jgi:hypothetical protein
LLNTNGNVVGVVLAMLDAKTAFAVTGTIPQNVNCAVKSIYAHAIADSLPQAVDGLLPPARKSSFDKIVDRVKKSVVL